MTVLYKTFQAFPEKLEDAVQEYIDFMQEDGDIVEVLSMTQSTLHDTIVLSLCIRVTEIRK